MAPTSHALRTALVVYAKDLPRVAAFYAGVLGLQPVQTDAAYVVLQAGEVEVVVLSIPAHIAATFTVTSPPEVREDAALKPVFFVDDLRQVRLAAERCGGWLKPPQAQWRFRGTVVLDGCDPEGNVVQFRQLDDAGG